MSPRLNDLSQRPAQMDLQDPRGDVLSDVLSVGLLRNALYKRIDAGAPWGIRFQERAHQRAVFYLVGRGTARLEVSGERTLSLSAGDVVFLPHGSAHVLRDAPESKPVSACDGLRKADLSPLKLGGQGAVTTLIAG